MLMSSNLLKNRLQSKSPRKSHSLKRKKEPTDGKQRMMMHGMQFDLFVKQPNETAGQLAETATDNEMVNLIKTGQQVCQLLDYSEDRPRFIVDTVEMSVTLDPVNKLDRNTDYNGPTELPGQMDGHLTNQTDQTNVPTTQTNHQTDTEIRTEVNCVMNGLLDRSSQSSSIQRPFGSHSHAAFDDPPPFDNNFSGHQVANHFGSTFDSSQVQQQNSFACNSYSFVSHPGQPISDPNAIQNAAQFAYPNNQSVLHEIPLNHQFVQPNGFEHSQRASFDLPAYPPTDPQQIDQQFHQPFNSHFSSHQPSSNQFIYQSNSHPFTGHQEQFDQYGQDEVDFGSLISKSIENLNSASRQSDQSDHSPAIHQSTGSDYQQFTDLTSSSSAYSANTNGSDFSPPKGIPPEQLTFSNMINFSKGFENPAVCNVQFTNLHDDDKPIEDVYNFNSYFPTDEHTSDETTDKSNKKSTKKSTSKSTKKSVSKTKTDKTTSKKQDVKELTKSKSKKRKASQKDQNFVRIDVNKRKRYVKGHKKFNMKNYKSKEWKKLKEAAGNSCFKCGGEDHWARDCPKGDAELREIENENDYDELEEMADQADQLMVNSAQPLFEANDHYNMQVEIRNALEQFGFQAFRANQKEVCERILLSRSVLMISSTGSGKSLCYQLPAYIYYKLRKYITIVVTPLISLMEDQIRCLPKCLRAVCLHSGLGEAAKKANLAKIQAGEAQVLFLSPEYIMAHLFELSLLPTVGFVCIDEAHCLSEWSNNFRPSYLQFFQVLKERIRIHTFLALTATANRATARQVLKNIGLSLENDVVGMTRIPSNLVLTISRDSDKDFALVSLLKSERFCDLSSIIIYCSRRETTEKIATLLRIEMQKSKDPSIDQEWTATAYHAGLSYAEKLRIQKNFISGKLRVVVATLAFGMGINKSDVDGIIHFSLPKTIENYVQEIGRAGRNGRPAQCHLFLDHDTGDLFEQQKHIYSNGIDKINVKKLTAKLFKPCKCRKLRQFEEEQRMGDPNAQIDSKSPIDQYTQPNGQVNNRSNRCPSHENAFTVKELTEELDIKEETLLTILIYLELNLKHLNIRVMNKTNSTCILSCYKGGSRQLEALARQHPFVALPLAQLKKEQPNLEGQTIIRFSYINVASMLGQSSREVLRKLKGLAWKYEANRRIRSDVRVAFEDPSFHVVTPGDLSEAESEQIMQMILNYSKSQEVLEAKRLKAFYESLKECSQSKCTNKVNTSKSLKLKKILNDYYDLSRERSSLPEEDELEAAENLERIAGQSVILKQSNSSEIEEARRDIRDLINVHSAQFLSARAITRILQGIASPKYSAEVWGRDKRFWRKRIKMDFNLLLRLANEELVRIKCSA